MENKDVKLMKKLAEEVRICMFTTIRSGGNFNSRPMAHTAIDDDGSIWFFTNHYSPKSNEVTRDNSVSLGYSDPSSNTYLCINGNAEIVDDDRLKQKYFNPGVKVWFPDGTDDPRLTLIKVTPLTAEYWDSASSKMVVALNALTAIITGKPYDEGHHGNLDVGK